MTLFSVPGGDTTQVLKTAEALRKAGCHVDVSTDLEPDLSDYDLVHLFNLGRPQEVYLQSVNAKRQGKRIALSTIHVSYTEYERRAGPPATRLAANVLRPGQLEYLKVLARALKNREANKGTRALLAHGYENLQSKIIGMADVLLPNSESEMRRVASEFPSHPGKPYVVVPNAVDAELFDPRLAGPVSQEAEDLKGSVLCVGRIEGRKCQLNLVRAMRELPWPLVLIGNPAPNHLSYYRRVKHEAGPNTRFIDRIEHNRLPPFYRAARIHALVSWMETTGLSSLEAAAMGCNIVITGKGDTRDYFGDLAFYCEPDSVESIRRAIVKAHETPASRELAALVRERFTWDKTADKTLEGYSVALGSTGAIRSGRQIFSALPRR